MENQVDSAAPCHNGQHYAADGRPQRCCERRERQRGRFSLIEPALLAAIAGGEAHGYELRGEIESLSGLSVDPGGLYRVLRRLEDEGLVFSDWASGGSGPQKRVYGLTGDGHAMLVQWVGHLTEKEATIRRVREAIQRRVESGGEK